MESTMEQIKKQFKDADVSTRDFASSVIKTKIESSYLSNETIARVIVSSLMPSDAEDVLHWMHKLIRARYGKKQED